MSLESTHISLIDLTKQLPFHIGEVVKETDSQISWTSSESTPSNPTENSSSDEIEQKIKLEDSCVPMEKRESEIFDDQDFHFFFYPKCPEEISAHNSSTSVTLVDGVPQVNLTYLCKCNIDKFGKCLCFKRLPCKCRPPVPKKVTPKKECKCKNRGTKLCSCNEDKPKCKCATGQRCVCQFGYCTCDKQEELNPSAILVDTAPTTCDENQNIECSCDVSITCICPSPPEKDKNEPESVCEAPEDCQCHDQCFCKYSACDTKPVNQAIDNVCVSFDRLVGSGLKPESEEIPMTMRKLKRVPVGKEGYRWCYEVDPFHTYFDFGYGMQEKFEVIESDDEKFAIQGLHDNNKSSSCEETEHLDENTLPRFKKEIRKPSIDCCSVVGGKKTVNLGITISIETLGETKDQFLVQVISHSSKEGDKTGTKLISIVDCNLHTMEENRVEYITKRELTKEKRSYIALCDNGYYNKVSRTCGELQSVKRLQHSFGDARDFLLEGANILLLRYLAVQRHRGNVKTATVLMNGAICESFYVFDGDNELTKSRQARSVGKKKMSHGVSSAVVNAKEMQVVKVDRYVMEKNGTVYQTLTVLTLKGYTVSHEWVDSAYIVHLNPLLKIIPESNEIEPHAPLRSTWRQDLQLLSDYLDFKAERSSEGARYTSENGELAGAVCDYLQALLLMQPRDTLLFTRQYFGAALSTLDLPHNEYFDPEYNVLR
ncbi:Ciliogenesis-associated TTC17-interacting protein [Eumeta japonica]|uniref:Ciliogenesis-associated TTC17-interacting protein n=1 Tax=Eumeta variegata TaxID=151549 RepID=A0A4C1XEQ1_EUMVA|nr:Ciliogenesis-associated TTC17-interacting protein [Eumeta japonica]